MTSNKTALTAMVEFALSRKTRGFGSVKRMELQAVAEMANNFEGIVFVDKETLEEVARLTGGTYITSTGGKSKIVF